MTTTHHSTGTDSWTANGTYIFNTATDLGGEQVRCLEELYDADTTAMLTSTGPEPGWRALELGVGGGSIARWLADRVAPGEVVATDIDTTRADTGPGITVHQHDINDGLPVAGQFDLIHARLVLLHLPRRLEILDMLVDALRPGGWLVIGEFGPRLPSAITVSEPDDRAAFGRLFEIGHGTVGPAAGQSLHWGQECPQHMATAGLTDIASREHSFTVTGGDTGSRYMHNLMTQVRQPLIDAGLLQEEFDRGQAIFRDPHFRGWFYQFISTRGRKPHALT